MEKVTWFAAALITRAMLIKTHATEFAAKVQRVNFIPRANAVRNAINTLAPNWVAAASCLKGNSWFSEVDTSDLADILQTAHETVLGAEGTTVCGTTLQKEELCGETIPSWATMPPDADDSEDDSESKGDPDYPNFN